MQLGKPPWIRQRKLTGQQDSDQHVTLDNQGNHSETSVALEDKVQLPTRTFVYDILAEVSLAVKTVQ